MERDLPSNDHNKKLEIQEHKQDKISSIDPSTP